MNTWILFREWLNRYKLNHRGIIHHGWFTPKFTLKKWFAKVVTKGCYLNFVLFWNREKRPRTRYKFGRTVNYHSWQLWSFLILDANSAIVKSESRKKFNKIMKLITHSTIKTVFSAVGEYQFQNEKFREKPVFTVTCLWPQDSKQLGQNIIAKGI